MQKVIEHPVLGKILYIKRIRSKSIRVSVNFANEIKVSVPFFVTYGMAQTFVDSNLLKIQAIIKRVQSRNRPNGKNYAQPGSIKYTNDELEAIRKKARDILPQRLNYISSKLNDEVIIKNNLGIIKSAPFSYNKVFIKNNKTNWGSCSSKRNINLNMHLVNLTDDLIDFVIIHELCHLVYPNHGADFHKLVNTICKGKEAELHKELRKHTHILQGIK